jgi:hypothetical protein
VVIRTRKGQSSENSCHHLPRRFLEDGLIATMNGSYLQCI